MQPASPDPLRGTVPSQVLVIGCGNNLFGDDALGPLLAETIGDLGRPGVLALAVHELTPELAAPIAATGRVIFVDASLHDGDVTVTPLAPATNGDTGLNHALTPAALLALADTAFGRCPPATLILIPGVDFGLGHGLSDCARLGLQEAQTRLLDLL